MARVELMVDEIIQFEFDNTFHVSEDKNKVYMKSTIVLWSERTGCNLFLLPVFKNIKKIVTLNLVLTLSS